ncbi:MAG: GDP-L-fucose synthase [Flavobacteriales bacterium]|nr:GDP-L-fucose synthase [Flavobacteriales bacterium]
MNKDSRIYVAGHRGMVGSAIWRLLEQEGYSNLKGSNSTELDLRDQTAVQRFFENEKPEFVFLAAAKVGGIQANNTYRADFLYDNLAIEMNVIKAAHDFNVLKLLFLGSSCIYPRDASQPMKEEALLTGPLESTNEPYAIAKIAGIKLCEAFRDQYRRNFISAMPTNLYGPNDNYDLHNSHVLPALLRKFHEAKESKSDSVEVWGSGAPLREFLHVDDLASASLFLMKNYNERQFINVGSGKEVSIRDLVQLVQKIVGFSGEVKWNTEKPDGTPRKLMDNSRINQLGWRAMIDLETGIRAVYQEYDNQETLLRGV